MSNWKGMSSSSHQCLPTPQPWSPPGLSSHLQAASLCGPCTHPSPPKRLYSCSSLSLSLALSFSPVSTQTCYDISPLQRQIKTNKNKLLILWLLFLLLTTTFLHFPPQQISSKNFCMCCLSPPLLSSNDTASVGCQI